jgi:hypothetical protein
VTLTSGPAAACETATRRTVRTNSLPPIIRVESRAKHPMPSCTHHAVSVAPPLTCFELPCLKEKMMINFRRLPPSRDFPILFAFFCRLLSYFVAFCHVLRRFAPFGPLLQSPPMHCFSNIHGHILAFHPPPESPQTAHAHALFPPRRQLYIMGLIGRSRGVQWSWLGPAGSSQTDHSAAAAFPVNGRHSTIPASL